MLIIISITISISWLWIGTRFNYWRAGASFNDEGVKEILSMRRVEILGKFTATLAFICLGVIAYSYNDESLTLFYILIIGWLLFYLINLEVSSIYGKIGKLENEDKENRQYIMDRLREIKKSI